MSLFLLNRRKLYTLHILLSFFSKPVTMSLSSLLSLEEKYSPDLPLMFILVFIFSNWNNTLSFRFYLLKISLIYNQILKMMCKYLINFYSKSKFLYFYLYLFSSNKKKKNRSVFNFFRIAESEIPLLYISVKYGLESWQPEVGKRPKSQQVQLL